MRKGRRAELACRPLDVLHLAKQARLDPSPAHPARYDGLISGSRPQEAIDALPALAVEPGADVADILEGAVALGS
jgi:hypothetical protein